MLLKQIEYFQAVVETGSFSLAGERCHISQSAVSQQIKALEEEIGTPLLHRHNRTFSLTPAGELFYRKGTALRNEALRLIHDVHAAGTGESTVLRIGYLKCYGGSEFIDATAEFSAAHPEVKLEIINGNLEDLYQALRDEHVDIILNDQRRAFSDDYVNYELIQSHCYIELASHHPLAKKSRITTKDLENETCILVAGDHQQETEQTYYHDIVGFHGAFRFAETLSEARILVASGNGFLPVEGIRNDVYFGTAITRIPLYRNRTPVMRNYCAFWKADNSGWYVEEFAEILHRQFQ